MLRINQQRSVSGAKSYFNEGLAREDYYTRDEIQGRWQGRGADKLGLYGAVTKEAFHAMCDNTHPINGQKLTARTRTGRTVGYDFNFHAPKSLSLLYTMTEDQRLLETFQEAVQDAMQDLETAIKTRVRRGGRNDERTTGNLAYAEFVHLTSRPVNGVPDPHLHAHCFVFNATHDGVEDKWKAAQFRDVVRDAPYYEAVFHAKLSHAIAELGYGVERTKNGWEIAGILRPTLEKFSRRTAQIEELAEAKGVTSAKEKAGLGAKSRERKGESQPLLALRTEWKNRLTPDERHDLVKIIKKEVKAKEKPTTGREAIAYAMGNAFERASVISEKRLLASALKRGYGSCKVEDVKSAYAAEKGIIRREHAEQTFVTTRDVLAEESAVLAFARDGRGTCQALAISPDTLGGSWLNAGQKEAVRHVLDSTDRVMLIRGAAGTGKSSLLRAAALNIEAGLKRVHVFAPTTEAARGILRGEGFENADTVARLIADKRMQAGLKGQVIWIDEAGLLGTSDMKAVFRIAKEQNARVVLMGDERQHGSVPRGGVFRLLQSHAGIKAAEVNQILRQKNAEYKAAVQSLADGDLDKGFKQLDRLGYIQEISDGERHIRLAEDYLVTVRDGKSALVVAPTHAEGKEVTAHIRAALQAEGRLSTDERIFRQQVSFGMSEAMRSDALNYQAGDIVQWHQNASGGFRKGDRWEVAGRDAAGNVLISRFGRKTVALPLDKAKHFDVYERYDVAFAVGDRIRITQNGMAADGKKRLINGTLHTVVKFLRGNIVLDDGSVVAKNFGHIAHGYSTTSHSSQGKTVDKVMVAIGSESYPASSVEQFYVSVSRGRESCAIYCADKKELLEAVSRSSDRMTATELVEQDRQAPPGRNRLLRHGEIQRRRQRVEQMREAREVVPQKEQKRKRERER